MKMMNKMMKRKIAQNGRLDGDCAEMLNASVPSTKYK